MSWNVFFFHQHIHPLPYFIHKLCCNHNCFHRRAWFQSGWNRVFGVCVCEFVFSLICLFGLCSNDIFLQINQTLNAFILEYHVYLKSPFQEVEHSWYCQKVDCICAIDYGSQCISYVETVKFSVHLHLQAISKLLSFVSFAMWTKSIFVFIGISIVSLWMHTFYKHCWWLTLCKCAGFKYSWTYAALTNVVSVSLI